MFEPSTDLQSRAWVEVDLDALRANAEQVRRAAGPEATLLPMVKANAYGLGMLPVAKALAAAFPAPALAGFGVAAVAEGEALRAGGWRGRIVVFSPVVAAELPRAAAAELTLCVSDAATVEAWAALATASGRRLRFHVEIDTGMGRAGFAWDDAAAWGPRLHGLAADGLEWEGTFTHFHSADEPGREPTLRQQQRFEAALAALRSAVGGGPPPLIHVANSAAALRYPFAATWVRPGIFLYGGRVGAEPPSPVVAVRARVALVREAAAGATVGYGATYRARRPERWATLGIGYGDGLPRAIGGAGGAALLRGRRVPIVGRISMDMTVVALPAADPVEAGEVATLIGRAGSAEIALDEVAEQAGTISYEVLTGLSPRLGRVYGGSLASAVGRPWAAGHGPAPPPAD